MDYTRSFIFRQMAANPVFFVIKIIFAISRKLDVLNLNFRAVDDLLFHIL